MQRHVHKVMDPSYQGQKKKLSKYDQSILRASKKFSPLALERSLLYFKEMEFSLKTKDPLIESKIKRDFLRIR